MTTLALESAIGNRSFARLLARSRDASPGQSTKRMLQRVTSAEAEALRDYYAFLVRTREITPGEYDRVLDRIIERYDSYQEAATQLSYVLPIPTRKRLPPPSLEAARSFADAVTTVFHQAPYLAGGSAISLHGGRRPSGDFDFRIDTRGHLTGFRLPIGQKLLSLLNDRGAAAASRERAARDARRAGLGLPKIERDDTLDFTPLAVLGLDVTIGTKNWLGAEVSLSINDPAVGRHGALVTDLQGFTALSLVDLLGDKLKTTIARRKRGEENVKKVAQDLTDVLIVAELLSRDTGDPQFEPAAIRGLLEERLPGYVITNPERVSVRGLAEAQVVARMFERLILTARAHHGTEGRRAEKFQSLARSYAIDILEHLERLVQIDAPRTELPGEDKTLAEQFAIWNKPPFNHPSRVTGASVDAPQAAPAEAPGPASKLADILTGAPNFEKIDEALPKQAWHVLFVAGRSGGFRALREVEDLIELDAAFGLTRRQFRLGFTALRKSGYAVAEPEGLRLTESGLELYEAKLR